MMQKPPTAESQTVAGLRRRNAPTGKMNNNLMVENNLQQVLEQAKKRTEGGHSSLLFDTN